MEPKQHFSLRLDPKTVDRLVRHAAARGQPKTALAERYLEEGMRMADHPAIVFRDGPAGRRAGLAGRGLDVWEVIETVRGEAGNLEAAASYLGISTGLVSAGVAYYADYKDEVDAWIERNAHLAVESEASWRRRQEAFV